MADEKVVFLPYFGEFGFFIINHIRYVDSYPASSKIVCCEKGQESLFPSATGFYYNWKNPYPDEVRCGDGTLKSHIDESSHTHDYDAELSVVLNVLYPDHAVLRPRYYATIEENLSQPKFKPVVVKHLPSVDVALGVRHRKFYSDKNWPHWRKLIERLKEKNLTFGLVGAKETSFDTDADAKAWDHPDGETAGSMDILSRCKVYVGADNGISHLASFMDVPSILFRKDLESNPDNRYMMQKTNKSFCKKLDDSFWDKPSEVAKNVVEFLENSTGQKLAALTAAKRKYIVATGYYDNGKPYGHGADMSASQFFKIWYDNTRKYSDPKQIYVINAGSKMSRYGFCEWINMTDNIGYVAHLPEGQLLSGWGLAFLIACLVAYHCKCDLVFKEQDCLAFGNYIEVLYSEIGDKGMITGGPNTSGVAKGLVGQSLVLVKFNYLAEFVAKYLNITIPDKHLLTENKFVKIAEDGKIARTTMGYDRTRPIDYSLPAFYMQQITPQEIIDLKMAGLIT